MAKAAANKTAGRAAGRPGAAKTNPAAKRDTAVKKAAATKQNAAASESRKSAQARAAKKPSRPGTAEMKPASKKTTMTQRGKKAGAESPATAVDAQVLAHGLNSLLHTMQVVQQHEERLCSLMHALRRGKASHPLLGELRDVLQQLPAHDYLHEVDALRDAVAA